MTGDQSREARKLLGWSLSHVNRLCRFTRGTVQQFEAKNRMPIQKLTQAARFTPPTPDRIAILISVFKAAGVEFIPESGGVRLRKLKESSK